MHLTVNARQRHQRASWLCDVIWCYCLEHLSHHDNASLLVISHPASCPAGHHLQVTLCPGMRVTIEQLRLSSRQHTPRDLKTQQLGSLLHLAEQVRLEVLPADADSPGCGVGQHLQTKDLGGAADAGSLRRELSQGLGRPKPLRHRHQQAPDTPGGLGQPEGGQMQQQLSQAQGQGQGQRQQPTPGESPVGTAGQGLHEGMGSNMLPRTEPAAGALGLAPGGATCALASVEEASGGAIPQAVSLPLSSGCAEALTPAELPAASSMARERQAVDAATAAGLAAADAAKALAAQQTVQLSMLAAPGCLPSLPPASLSSLMADGAVDTQLRMPSGAITDSGMDFQGCSSHVEEKPSAMSR